MANIPFAWPEHFRRLQASAQALRMPLDLDEATVATRVAATLEAAGREAGAWPDRYVRLIVTRGVGEAPNIDLAYASGPPCWLIFVRPLPTLTGKPARLALVERLRNDRRALDPATKSGNYLNNILGLAEAKAAGATDCVMRNADGFVTEASTSNLFVRLDGVWCTPPLDSGILAGVTRALLLEWLPRVGERVSERHLNAADLSRAEELFLSSSLRDIAPVTHLDGQALHDGAPGPHSARLLPAFQTHCADLLRQHYAPAWRRLLAAPDSDAPIGPVP